MKYYVDWDPGDPHVKHHDEYDYAEDAKELAWLRATEQLLDDGKHEEMLSEVRSRQAYIKRRQKMGRNIYDRD